MNKKTQALDLNSIFTDEWCKNIIDASTFAINKLSQSYIFDMDEVVNRVVEYNIEKALDEAILPNLVNTLPKTLDWTKTSVTDAFSEFKDIIDSCDLCPTFKEYKVKIIVKDRAVLLEQFEMWKECVNKYYPHLTITLSDSKTKAAFYMKVTLS